MNFKYPNCQLWQTLIQYFLKQKKLVKKKTPEVFGGKLLAAYEKKAIWVSVKV